MVGTPPLLLPSMILATLVIPSAMLVTMLVIHSVMMVSAVAKPLVTRLAVAEVELQAAAASIAAKLGKFVQLHCSYGTSLTVWQTYEG